jgi:branched-chain amino acid transport system substrate-binding protein
MLEEEKVLNQGPEVKRKMRTFVRTILALTATALASTVLAAGASSTANGATSSGIPAGPITFAANLPLSGSLSGLGVNFKAGAIAAINAINKSGGILGHKLKMVLQDTAGDPSQAAVAARDVLSQHPAFFIPDQLGNTTPAILPIINEFKVPTLTAVEDVTSTFNPKTNPWLFNFNLATQQEDKFQVDYLNKSLGLKKIGIIDQSDIFPDDGTFSAAAIKAEHIGYAGTQTFVTGTTDVTSQLTALKNAGATGIVVWTFGPGLNTVVSGLASLGWNVPAVGPPGVSESSATQAISAAKLTNFYGSPAPTSFLSKAPGGMPTTAQARAFYSRYVAAGGVPASAQTSAYIYDEVLVGAAAIKLAHSIQPAAVKRALESGVVFTGSRGTYKFTPKNHLGYALSNQGVFQGADSCAATCVAAKVQP